MGSYFEDQINTGQPIVPPAPPAPEIPKPPVQEAETVSPSGEWQGLPVRTMGDRVFLLKGGKKYWVSNPEVYNKLGFKFGDEVKIDQSSLDIFPEGEPLR